VIGKSKVDLDGDCRTRECNLGNLITDAAVYFFAQRNIDDGWTDAPIALLNGGSIRAGIPALDKKGILKKEDIFNVWPFGNKLTRLNVNGTQLRLALEKSVEHYDQTGVIKRGGFLQYSGIQVVYDLNRPPMARVTSAWVRCGRCRIPEFLPLFENENYTIITSDYLSRGGDGYYMLTPSPEITIPTGVDELHIFEFFVSKFGPVFPAVERRIVFESFVTMSSSYRTTWSLVTLALPIILPTYLSLA
jgi:2',3'-cyclic-nucleotide 2'-phosphodiesterase (5'-nucleotidase family)